MLIVLAAVGSVAVRRFLTDPQREAIRDRVEVEQVSDGTKCFVYPPHAHFRHPPFEDECPKSAAIFCTRAVEAQIQNRCERR